ncbi:hypothetical protein CYMTET_22827 [Cymbomonas tetramitiformis]|uniref:Uncharacterized protein n=1 Tax=Cymbomonas tetramitiformis TaxID=36881 RepID=A0AAE0L1U0_9CHLO|nr:hypothetical protein CYMTET_22827 [Cymbomonas tetramitiformis]
MPSVLLAPLCTVWRGLGRICLVPATQPAGRPTEVARLNLHTKALQQVIDQHQCGLRSLSSDRAAFLHLGRIIAASALALAADHCGSLTALSG